MPRPLLATIALVAALAVGCGSPPFASRDLSPPGARHVAVAMQPTIVDSDDGSAPGLCGRVCAPARRPGEHVERCRPLRLEPSLASDLRRHDAKVVLCTLR